MLNDDWWRWSMSDGRKGKEKRIARARNSAEMATSRLRFLDFG